VCQNLFCRLSESIALFERCGAWAKTASIERKQPVLVSDLLLPPWLFVLLLVVFYNDLR
jgi:hypothetical protein